MPLQLKPASPRRLLRTKRTILTLLRHFHCLCYLSLVDSTCANGVYNRQVRYRAIVNRHGYDLENGRRVVDRATTLTTTTANAVNDASSPAAASSATPKKLKRGRASKKSEVDESPLAKKAKKGARILRTTEMMRELGTLRMVQLRALKLLWLLRGVLSHRFGFEGKP